MAGIKPGQADPHTKTGWTQKSESAMQLKGAMGKRCLPPLQWQWPAMGTQETRSPAQQADNMHFVV